MKVEREGFRRVIETSDALSSEGVATFQVHAEMWSSSFVIGETEIATLGDRIVGRKVKALLKA